MQSAGGARGGSTPDGAEERGAATEPGERRAAPRERAERPDGSEPSRRPEQTAEGAAV